MSGIRFDFDVRGISAGLVDISIFQLALKQKIANIVNKTALDIQRGAKQRCPVDTGRLRSSIRIKPVTVGGQYNIVVEANVEYAPFVEFGTRRMSPRPFLFPAAEEQMPIFEAAIRAAMPS